MFRGQVLKNEPASSATYGEVEIEYEVMPGWNEDISKVKSFGELPPNCKSFVLRIEELVGVPIKWIGVGPWMEEMASSTCIDYRIISSSLDNKNTSLYLLQ